MKAWIHDLYIKTSQGQNIAALCVHLGGLTKKYRVAGRGLNLTNGYEVQDFIQKLNNGSICMDNK